MKHILGTIVVGFILLLGASMPVQGQSADAPRSTTKPCREATDLKDTILRTVRSKLDKVNRMKVPADNEAATEGLNAIIGLLKKINWSKDSNALVAEIEKFFRVSIANLSKQLPQDRTFVFYSVYVPMVTATYLFERLWESEVSCDIPNPISSTEYIFRQISASLQKAKRGLDYANTLGKGEKRQKEIAGFLQCAKVAGHLVDVVVVPESGKATQKKLDAALKKLLFYAAYDELLLAQEELKCMITLAQSLKGLCPVVAPPPCDPCQ